MNYQKKSYINDVWFFWVIFDPPPPLNPIFTFYNPIFWGHFRLKSDFILYNPEAKMLIYRSQRYPYRVLQTIQMKVTAHK